LVEDTLGDAFWSATGPGTVFPTCGASTTLTADLVEDETELAVTVEVWDSGLFAADPIVFVQHRMKTVVPNGLHVVSVRDDPEEHWIPGNKHLGARTWFAVQVVPDTANFARVRFRENYKGHTFVWPDGYNENWKPYLVEYRVVSIGKLYLFNYLQNALSWIGPYPIGRLAGKDYSISSSSNQEWLTAYGKWVPFATWTARYEFNGTTNEARVGALARNELWGGWMGPWK
jgi:hypothetical protein